MVSLSEGRTLQIQARKNKDQTHDQTITCKFQSWCSNTAMHVSRSSTPVHCCKLQYNKCLVTQTLVPHTTASSQYGTVVTTRDVFFEALSCLNAASRQFFTCLDLVPALITSCLGRDQFASSLRLASLVSAQPRLSLYSNPNNYRESMMQGFEQHTCSWLQQYWLLNTMIPQKWLCWHWASIPEVTT